MSYCANCGVELESDMASCPLCGTSVANSGKKIPSGANIERSDIATVSITPKERHLLQRILWQVTSILLLSGIVSTLIINLAIQKSISWSVYPVTVCTIMFSYASLFAFWRTKRIYQVVGGLLIATALFILLHFLLPESRWPLQLGLPLLWAANLIAIILIVWVSLIPHRGLNVIAFTCVAIAALCISIDGILSIYDKSRIVLRWSVIVAACMLPVTAALLFMHFRTKKDPGLKKIFHT